MTQTVFHRFGISLQRRGRPYITQDLSRAVGAYFRDPERISAEPTDRHHDVAVVTSDTPEFPNTLAIAELSAHQRACHVLGECN